jgi:hypothetical protein
VGSGLRQKRAHDQLLCCLPWPVPPKGRPCLFRGFGFAVQRHLLVALGEMVPDPCEHLVLGARFSSISAMAELNRSGKSVFSRKAVYMSRAERRQCPRFFIRYKPNALGRRLGKPRRNSSASISGQFYRSILHSMRFTAPRAVKAET